LIAAFILLQAPARNDNRSIDVPSADTRYTIAANRQ
jgi:hypothetical protein